MTLEELIEKWRQKPVIQILFHLRYFDCSSVRWIPTWFRHSIKKSEDSMELSVFPGTPHH